MKSRSPAQKTEKLFFQHFQLFFQLGRLITKKLKTRETTPFDGFSHIPPKTTPFDAFSTYPPKRPHLTRFQRIPQNNPTGEGKGEAILSSDTRRK